MEQIRKKINEKRTIKTVTINNYLRTVRILCNSTTGNDWNGSLDFLRDFTAVKMELDKMKLSTRKTALASISVVAGDNDFDAEILKKYRKEMIKVKIEYNKGLEGREKSEREASNWVSLKELGVVLKRLGQSCRDRNIGVKGPDALDKRDFRLLQKFVIASLYLLDNEPRRNIYSTMEIIGKNDIIEKGKNYLVVYGRNRKEFVITNQKSRSFTSTQRIVVNKKLNKVLNIWVKYNKSGFLLLDSNGKKMNPNQLTKALNAIFVNTGKKISSSMIRKIWLTEHFNGEMSAMEEVANKMGHSVSTAALHYVKRD